MRCPRCERLEQLLVAQCNAIETTARCIGVLHDDPMPASLRQWWNEFKGVRDAERRERERARECVHEHTCACGAVCVPHTPYCYTCHPTYPRRR